MVKKSSNLFFSDSYGWRRITTPNAKLYIHGIAEHSQTILMSLLSSAKLSDQVLELLKAEYGSFGIIIEHPEFIFASVDRLRSYPIYYAYDNGEIFIGNSADKLKKHCQIDKLNSQSLLEFNMAGYVFNRDTLYQNMYQLQAGECLLWKKTWKTPKIRRYYRYISSPKQMQSPSDFQAQLSCVIDKVVERTIDRAHGAPIWVPLSGGLDSRLILAKLVEHQYGKLQAFSYGMPGNFEAKRAKQTAEQLGVPWIFCPFKAKRMKEPGYVHSRNSYTSFAAGLCAVPSYLGFEALYTLKRNKIIPSDAVILNGQSGDFITGGHVPRLLYDKETTLQQILDALLNKHCSLWLDLKTPENLKLIQDRIINQLPDLNNSIAAIDRLYSNYESWEWEERQSKAVVNGQRIYDFFQLKWLLPLWDSELMDFWEHIPYPLKINQALYRDYLKEYNYKGVFDTLRDDANPWIHKYAWIPWVARFVGFFAGKNLKAKYYHHMYYYATDHDQYAYYGRKHYLKNYKIARNVTSFDVVSYLNRIAMQNI